MAEETTVAAPGAVAPEIESAKLKVLSELYAALAKAQGEFEPIEKNREVTIKPRDKAAYSFRYADLEEVISKTRPALSKNGLALIQTMQQAPAGVILSCILAHSSGARITSSVQLPQWAENDPKQLGALITYYRRYLVVPMLGVAADDDLDEDGREPGEGDQRQPGQGEGNPAKKRTDLPPYTDSALKADIKSVSKAMASGRVTLDDAITQIRTRFDMSEGMEKRLRDAVEEAAGQIEQQGAGKK